MGGQCSFHQIKILTNLFCREVGAEEKIKFFRATNQDFRIVLNNVLPSMKSAEENSLTVPASGGGNLPHGGRPWVQTSWIPINTSLLNFPI